MKSSLFTLTHLRKNAQDSWQTRGAWSSVAILLAVFLFAKTAGLIHHEIHPFHHHSETCEMFQAMAHPATDDVYELELFSEKPVYELQDFVLVSQLVPASYPAFWGRAPPSLSI